MNRTRLENEIFGIPPEAIQVRFWARVRRSEDANGCWEWTGHIGTHGYGRLTVNYRGLLAHRVAFVLENGPIPDGLWVLHRCDNPACCRPDHLFLGTAQENTEDMVEKGRNARGDRNGSHTRPDRRPTGERHWTTTRPDLIRRGEAGTNALLTETEIGDIRRRYAAGNTTLTALAQRYGITRQNVRKIVTRQTWKHLP